MGIKSLIPRSALLIRAFALYYRQAFFIRTRPIVMMASWTPIKNPGCLGELPETPEPMFYPVLKVPANATEILVYAFVTSKETSPSPPQRAFYIISTSSGGKKYEAYLNTLFDATSANSENIWLPMTDGKIQAELFIQKDKGCKKHKKIPQGTPLKECMAMDDDVVSGIFVIGYRS